MLFARRASGCSHISMEKAASELGNDNSIRLIDVRTPDEYKRGHIPGSRNIPADRIAEITQSVPDRGAKLFVYCLSGSRSAYACDTLVRLGYTDVTNIGGIAQWDGEIESASSTVR